MAESSESKLPVESAIELVGRPEQLRGQTVHAGGEVGLIDELGEEPRSAADIAMELELSEAYTDRLLRALDVYGVVEEVASGRFGLTTVGERFQRHHPEPVQDYLRFFYNPTRLAAVRHLPAVVAAGGPTSYELSTVGACSSCSTTIRSSASSSTGCRTCPRWGRPRRSSIR